jgi:hypothetical protein
MQASALQDRENLNRGDVSDSDEPDHGLDVHVNNPDVAPTSRKIAADIHYFFDKTGDKVVCKECK